MPAHESVHELLGALGALAMENPKVAVDTAAAGDLVRRGTAPALATATDQAVRSRLVDAMMRLTSGGWRQSEVERVVGRRCAAAGVAAVLDDVNLLCRGEQGWWQDQRWFEASLRRGADRAKVAVSVSALCGVLGALDPLPLFDPTDDADGDSGMLRKVRALLAKAESTDFVEEAEALTTKAQALITRHALDGLDLDPELRSAVRSRRIALDAPYASAKSVLLGRVAAANRCRSVQCRFTETAIVIGVPSDLAAVEMLYTSLLTQATTSMLASGSVADGRGRSRTKSYRRSFLLGFAQRIGVRLDEATSAAVDAASSSSSSSLLPALRARSEAVDEAMRAAFPSVQMRRVNHSNGLGYGAGDRAGTTADLGSARVRGPRGRLPA